MTALAADSNRNKMGGTSFVVPESLSFAAKGSKVFYKGGLACIDSANGYATPGATSTTLRVMGVTDAKLDTTGIADGASLLAVRSGVFAFANSTAGDLIATTEIGAQCFIVDDNTVAKTNGGATRSVAGIVCGIRADGFVWVRVAPGGF